MWTVITARMKLYYNVAGFTFGLEMPDDSSVWKLLGNYSPFQTEACATLFDVFICETLPVGEPELIYRERLEEPESPRIDISKLAGGYLFEMYPDSKYEHPSKLWLNDDFSVGKLKPCFEERPNRFPVDNALMLTFALKTAGFKTLEMHASVIEKDGAGYIFLGKSGTGKSTHSRMWLESIPGSQLLNDDNPVVRVMDDGTVRVFGTPWSGKTPCYRNRNCRAAAFVQLKQYTDNVIRRMSLLESYASLYSSSSGMKMDTNMTDKLHSTLECVLACVPCWQLCCLPDNEAAAVCYETVKDGN